LFFCAFVVTRIRAEAGHTLARMLLTLALGIIAISAALLISYLGSFDDANIWQAAMLVLMYAGIYLSLTRFFLNDVLTEITILGVRGTSALARATR
jgi:hypothetical protein